jgi:thymidylate kinase
MNCIAVYIIREYQEGRLFSVSREALVANRKRPGDFWAAGPKAEYAYPRAKRFWKGMISPQQEQRLESLEVQLGWTRTQTTFVELLPDNWKRRLAAADQTGYPGKGSVRTTQLCWSKLFRTPIKVIRCLFDDGLRRTQCWLRPTGLFVVILGPDGVGKSTVIKHLIDATAPAFRGNRVFHWRPMSLWRRRYVGTVTNPHGQPPHSTWWSVARIFSHILDYWFGYWWKIRPLLAGSNLIVFDRYFYDLMIDPLRYRYGGPRWLIPALSPLIPKPDLVLVLDAPDEVILSRKQEVDFREVRRQRQCYREFAGKIANADIVRTDQGIAQIVRKLSQLLTGLLVQRFHHQQSGSILCESFPGARN